MDLSTDDHDVALADREKLIRRCIVCDADDAEPVFTFNRRFLRDVCGKSDASLDADGWTDDTETTIVRCRQCGCNYIRDAIMYVDDVGAENVDDPALAAEHAAYFEARDSRKNYRNFDDINWIIRTLIYLGKDGHTENIRYLDFGAGGGTSCNTARAYGVREVVAYDRYSSIRQSWYDKYGHPGICFTRDAAELPDLGPFHAVVCQSVMEHVLDPRGELETIFGAMAPGGYLYVNNPVMPLDREVGALRSATSITKRDPVSCYQPRHFNYMMPHHFKRMLREVGFEVTPLVHYPPVPFVAGFYRRKLVRDAKWLLRTAQNMVGWPYHRHFFIVRKPG